MTQLSSETIFKIPEGSFLARADLLIQELLRMLKQEAPSADTFHALADRLKVPNIPPARIYFFTQLYEQVHAFPIRLFPAQERREEMLYAIQDALDSAIISEE